MESYNCVILTEHTTKPGKYITDHIHAILKSHNQLLHRALWGFELNNAPFMELFTNESKTSGTYLPRLRYGGVYLQAKQGKSLLIHPDKLQAQGWRFDYVFPTDKISYNFKLQVKENKSQPFGSHFAEVINDNVVTVEYGSQGYEQPISLLHPPIGCRPLIKYLLTICNHIAYIMIFYHPKNPLTGWEPTTHPDAVVFRFNPVEMYAQNYSCIPPNDLSWLEHY